MVKNMSSVDTF